MNWGTKAERKGRFDGWLDVQSKMGDKSIRRTDLYNMFVASYPDLAGEFDGLLRSYMARNKHVISMDKVKVYFNVDGASTSKFQHKAARDSKRLHQKRLRDSRTEYNRERTDWFYSQWQSTGACPPHYPTFPEIQNASEEEKYNPVHYRLPDREPAEKSRKIENSRYKFV